ncbi:MAG TPA: redoxin family protein [Terriglobales bacterium]|nr:redoxin family protein [Terriglobales bacterium]
MFGYKPYNYAAFTREQGLENLRAGFRDAPEPGERAPDFTLRTLDGDPFRLSDFRGNKNLVLSFGSATCPMTAASIRSLNRLAKRYASDDVEFALIYVREAHPGDQLPAHRTPAQKAAAAECLRDEEDVHIPIAIDDVRGTVHRRWGKLANPAFVIDKSGRVAYRMLWAQGRPLAAALDELLRLQQRAAEGDGRHESVVVRGGEDTSTPYTGAAVFMWRALERGGRRSIENFQEAVGIPGRLTLMGSRVVEPIVLNPGNAAAGALLAGGVITAALMGGSRLRRERLKRRLPYEIEQRRRPSRDDTDDYEAVGI